MNGYSSHTGGILATGDVHHLLWSIQEKYYSWWEYPAKIYVLTCCFDPQKIPQPLSILLATRKSSWKNMERQTFDFVCRRKRTLNTCLIDVMSHDCNEINFLEWMMNEWMGLVSFSCKVAFWRNIYGRIHTRLLPFFFLGVYTWCFLAS